MSKAVHNETGRVFALKVIEKKLIKKAKMVNQVVNEIKIMYSLNHENIIKLVNHFEDEEKCYLLIEYAAGGQVFNQMMKQPTKRFPEKVVARVSECLN